MNTGPDNHSPDPQARFLHEAGDAVRFSLFQARFSNWRITLAGALGLGWLVGGMYFYLTGARSLFIWMALNTGTYIAIGVMCWRYEHTRPPADSDSQRRWLRAWTCIGVVGGLISGSLLWFLPAEGTALQLSAALIIAIGMIAHVASRGHRPILYATVISTAASLSLALIVHAGLPLAVPVCLLFCGFVLVLGLTLNRAMLDAIGQRLYAQHLADELRRSHRHQLQVQRLETALHERQRVMEDMHDGLGSALVSSLLMLETGRMSAAQAAAVMRECLDDLRLITDSQASAEDLPTMLGMLRNRLQERIQAAGIALHWQMEDLPPQIGLNASQSLDLMRTVQEALTNALQHAGANRLEINARQMPGQIEIGVRDNGRGFDTLVASGAGRGLRSMRTRAQRIGAALAIESLPGAGCCITLRVPIT